MKRIVQRLVIGFLLVAAVACAPAGRDSSQSTGPEPTNTPSGEPQGGQAGKARVESVDILILESFPVQVHAVARGNLPDGCTEIDQVTQTREGNTFQVTITTHRSTKLVCTEALVPFEHTVPLDVVGLDAGTYTVIVDGATGTFELSQKNAIPADEPGSGGVIVGDAPVDSVEVLLVRGDAPQAHVVVKGNLPDGCTKVARSDQAIEGNRIIVNITTERPDNVMCTQALVPYEEIVRVDIAGLAAGTYDVVVNNSVRATIGLD